MISPHELKSYIDIIIRDIAATDISSRTEQNEFLMRMASDIQTTKLSGNMLEKLRKDLFIEMASQTPLEITQVEIQMNLMKRPIWQRWLLYLCPSKRQIANYQVAPNDIGTKITINIQRSNNGEFTSNISIN